MEVRKVVSMKGGKFGRKEVWKEGGGRNERKKEVWKEGGKEGSK